MSLPAGARIGPYQIVGALGAGGMGEVYRATDTNLGRQVAIKILPETLADDADRIARFDREARTLAALNHPNIAAIYGLERSGATTALVMELVEGDTLADRIARGPLPLDEALPIARQVAEALEAAHEQGIVHRDLKPANIKVRDDGAVKVLDFGLAKALDPAGAASWPGDSMAPTITSPAMLTGVATILGTAAYMSPEQAAGKRVDRRSDIWAFGVVLWEMLTGRRLFDGETVPETIAAVLRAPIDFTALPAATPRTLRELIARCLDRDVKTRLRDIGEARILLERPAHEPRTEPRTLEHERGTRNPERRTFPAAAWAALAAVCLAGAVAAAYVVSRPSAPTERPLLRFAAALGGEMSMAVAEGPSLALSADESRLAFIVSGGDTTRLAVTSLQNGALRVLDGTDGADTPFFSPDGTWIGFIAGTQLKKVAVEGGAPVLLHDLGAGLRGGGFWGEDGYIYFAGQRTPVMRIAADGGTPAAVTDLNAEAGDVSHRGAQLLPGAQAILFSVSNDNNAWDGGTIQAQPLAGGERRTLVSGGYAARFIPGPAGDAGHLVYVQNGTLFAAPMDLERLELTGSAVPVVQDLASRAANGMAHYAVTASGTLAYAVSEGEGTFSLSWTDATGRDAPLPARPRQSILFPRISPDGERIALLASDGGSFDLMAYEWRQDRMTRLTFVRGVIGPIAWTPDGRFISFTMTSAELEGPGIYVVRSDGGGEPQRLIAGRGVNAFSFAPDGSRLAYSHVEPPFGLWTVPLDWRDPQRPVAGTPELFLESRTDVRAPAFSPDGRWIAYRSLESGRSEVFVRPYPGPGGKWQVSTRGGDLPMWSASRPELFFQSGGLLTAAPYSTTGEAFTAGQPRTWLATPVPGAAFAVAPDGTRAVVARPTTGAANATRQTHATFLLNFGDELRRRTADR